MPRRCRAPDSLSTRSPAEAARYIRSGEVVAFPTETVYGLAAVATDHDAIGGEEVVECRSFAQELGVARDVYIGADGLANAFLDGHPLVNGVTAGRLALADDTSGGVRDPADSGGEHVVWLIGGDTSDVEEFIDAVESTATPMHTAHEADIIDLERAYSSRR